MTSTCKFVFDRPNPVYYSGETINGHITLRTIKDKTVRGVYIIFEGAAKVHWEEHLSQYRNGKKEFSTVDFYGNDTYLKTQTCVFGEGTLMAGTHEYTFSIPLPLECPTSCTEKYGKIGYEITLKIDRPLGFDNEFDQPLSVIKQFNLNRFPEYLIPLRGEDIKYFCCWPCTSGPVMSTLTIPFGGWAPGQEITYKLEVDNQSGYSLSGTRLKLKQIYTFKANSPRRKKRSHDNTLAQLEQEDRFVLRLSKHTFEGKLRVPPVPPTTSKGSGIITVSYLIEMYIHTGDYHKDCEILIPITIGSIPLAQTATNQDYIIALPATAPSPSPDTPDSLDMPPRYDICMPPTFEEATHIGEKFQDTDKNEYRSKSTGDWIPKYPMYNNFSVPTAAGAPWTDYNEQGVYIIFEGVGKVRWSEKRTRKRNGKTQKYTEHFYSSETYLSTNTPVVGAGILPPGTQEYTISIPLPLQCPTSCTEKYGHISYAFTLKLDRPFRFDNEFTQPLSVIKQLNLNHSTEYLVPLRGEDIKYFCFWPCSSGPVISTLTIPFGGWAPGQEIIYKLEIDNQSHGYDLSGTKLKLIQTYNFTAHAPQYKTRSHDNILARLKEEGQTVMRVSKRIFEGKLLIPPVPPTTLGSDIITVSYRIEMKVRTGGCRKDSKIWIPITIGTIPLAQTASNPDHIIALPATTPTPDTSDPLDMPPRYDICMPPTFEGATHIGEKFKDTDKNDYHNKRTDDWIPKYPMYNNFSVPTVASAPPNDING